MNTRVLFVPVSAPCGMGEYARCVTLADALVARRRDVRPHFLLSREAPYAAHCPHEHTLLPRSPTLSGAETTAAMLRVGAGVVVFDNAGRSSHIEAAARSGAAVIYISSRPRQRNKAFRLRWMGRLAEHWIALPECRETRLTPYEYAKVCWHPAGPQVRFIDAVLPERSTTPLTMQSPTRVLVVPGAGTAHPGAASAPQVFAAAAAQIAAAGHDVLYVGAMATAPPVDASRMRQVDRVPGGVLRTLMERADLVVTNGGDTLLQALALGKACVAAPVARDQSSRLGMLRGVRVARLEASEITAASTTLLQDNVALARLRRVAVGLNVRDCREQACAALLQLLDREPGALVDDGLARAMAVARR